MTNLKGVQRQVRVPVVLTQAEVKATFAQIQGTPRLIAELVYGAGLRIHECVSLWIKDVDPASRALSVRGSKGSKDRTTVLPERLVSNIS